MGTFLEYLKIFILLFGGLGMFLYGMKLMGEGLEVSAGSGLKKFLKILTNNRFMGIIVGVILTVAMQSSSATTVMLVGFVNAGLMNLAQTVGVIMGANIGTTLTGVLIALKVTDYTPIAILLGVALIMFGKKKNTKFVGQAIAGFGILFFGMAAMSESMSALREMPGAEDAIRQLFSYTSNPILGLLAGAIVTAVIQSSAGTMAILISMAGMGMIDLQGAVFVLYGTNIGTCITAVLASMGANKTGKRTAVIHLMFNVLGSVIFAIITMLPIGFTDMIKSWTDDVGQQMALTHVVFNIGTTVLLFPFANLLVRIATKLVPGDLDARAEMRLQYFDERMLNTPPIAAEQMLKEVGRMADLSFVNYQNAVKVCIHREDTLINESMENEEVINFLNHEITKYLVKVSNVELNSQDNKMVGSLYHVVNDLERIGDHAENLVEFSDALLEDKSLFSEEAHAELIRMSESVEDILRESIAVFNAQQYDAAKLEEIQNKEEAIDDLVEEFKSNHINRLNKNNCSPKSGMLFINMLNDFERIADHSTNIAYSLCYQVKK